jgi:hypothetical protein
MKLFAIYIGGEHERANIELHDMRFIAAPSLEDTFEELRKQWWGKPESLHIDCWAEISSADGYRVSLEPAPFKGPERLYYVNLGGYDRSEFIEKHKNAFVVATSAPDARKKAVAQVKSRWYAPHRDEMYEAEQVFSLDDAANGRQLHIHLTPTPDAPAFEFTCKYYPLPRITPPESA